MGFRFNEPDNALLVWQKRKELRTKGRINTLCLFDHIITDIKRDFHPYELKYEGDYLVYTPSCNKTK